MGFRRKNSTKTTEQSWLPGTNAPAPPRTPLNFIVYVLLWSSPLDLPGLPTPGWPPVGTLHTLTTRRGTLRTMGCSCLDSQNANVKSARGRPTSELALDQVLGTLGTRGLHACFGPNRRTCVTQSCGQLTVTEYGKLKNLLFFSSQDKHAPGFFW